MLRKEEDSVLGEYRPGGRHRDNDLSARIQMLGSTCGVLTRGSRMVVFGLRPTSLIIMGFMFGESALGVLTSWL